MSKKDEPIVKIVGRNIKTARLNMEYTREQLAERAEISVRYLTAIENETRRPSLEVLYRLLHSLGVSADEIFYSDKESNADANHILRLYQDCSERDKAIIRDILDSFHDRK